jgi:phage terminase large subunit-like protein
VLRAADLAELPKEARTDFIARLSPEEAALLPYFWEFWARPEQLLPAGDWVYWLPLGGRGWRRDRGRRRRQDHILFGRRLG